MNTISKTLVILKIPTTYPPPWCDQQHFKATMNISDDDYSVQILFCVLNGASVLVCLLAAIMVFALKLHSKIVYRLALYQVLSALVFSTVETLEIIFVNYEKSPAPIVYGRLCNTIGWLVMYTQWVKLLFTAWLTVHLFCFGVLYKNLKKLEILYVITSLYSYQ